MDRQTSIDRSQRAGLHERSYLQTQLDRAVEHRRIQGDWVFAERHNPSDPITAFAHVAAPMAERGPLAQELIGVLTVTWEEQAADHPARWYCDLFGKTAILSVPLEQMVFVLRYAEHWALSAGYWL